MTLTSAPKQNILWRPADGVQTDWLRCSAFEKLMAGGAGAGKSSCLLAAAAAESANPAMRSLILRLSYPMLKDLIAASHLIYGPMGARYNVTLHQWTFPSNSIVEFGAIENTEAAIMNYSGRSFSFVGVDELVQLPGDSVDASGAPISGAYSFLKSRTRSVEGSGLSLTLASTGTPGGIGQSWIRSYFGIGESGESCETRDPITGTRRAYFHCTVADNPALRATSYAARLEGLPPAQRKALLFGDWSSYVGQVFEEWSYDRHTCEPFNLPESWDAWLGADDGYAAPAAVLLFAHDRTRDRIFIMDEIYQRGLTPEELADETLAMCERHGRGSLDGVIDSSAFSEIGLGNESGKGSRGHIMNQRACRWKPSVKGAGSRVQGVDAIHRWLALRDDGYGGLVVCRNCRNLIRTLPAMVYDKTNPEDIDPACEEHAVKALMYGLTRTKTFFARVRLKGI